VSGRLERLALRSGAIALEGLAVEGLTAEPLKGSLRIVRGELDGRLQARRLDLDSVRRVLGLRFPLRGEVDVDIDLKPGKTGRTGHVALALRDGGMLVLSGLQADLRADFDGQRVRSAGKIALSMPQAPGAAPAPTSAEGCGGTIATLVLDGVDGSLDGPLLDPDTYRNATGRVTLRAEEVKLACLGQLAAMTFYPTTSPPLRELGGTANAALELERLAPQALPSVRSLLVRTEGLRLETRPTGPDEQAWRSDRLDLELTGTFDGPTARASAALAVRDPRLLGSAQATLKLDPQQLQRSAAEAAQALLEGGLSLRIALPRTDLARLASLPEPLRSARPPIAGQVQVEGHLEGTVRDPHAAVRLRGYDLVYEPEGTRGASKNPWAMPIDVDLLASYGSERATVDGRVDHRGRTVAILEASARRAPAAPCPADGSGAGTCRSGDEKVGPWSAQATLGLSDLPLSALPRLAEARVRGKVSGTVALRDLGIEPKPEVALEVKGFGVGKTAVFDRARLALRPADTPDGTTLVANASLTARTGGSLSAAAYADVLWTDGWRPSIAADRAADLFVRAGAFPLEVLHPLVEPAVSKLEGSLAGDLRLQWQQIAATDEVDLTMDMQVTDGVVHVPQVGQELSGVTARVRTAPGGLLMVQDVSAAAATGRATGWMTARLDGLDLVDLSGQVAVAEGEEIPVTVEGVPLGTARGRLILQATRKPDRYDLTVSAVDVHLALPSSPTTSVQPLRDNPDIHLSHPLGPSEAPRRIGGVPLRITAALRQAEIEGNGLRILLSSDPDRPPQLMIAGETEVSGELVIEGGEFDLLGLGGGIKLFEIERGLLRLRAAEPDNPYVNVSASHRAPDGSIIYVEYSGNLTPITRDKIRFSSSPPRSQEEILAVLLFGEAEALDPTGGPSATDDPTARSSSGGGGIAAYQLNALLGGIPSLRGVSTSIGTTDEGYTSTSVRYQLTDGLTAQATYERRTGGGVDEPPGQQATAGEEAIESRTKLSVDWRFYRDWLIRGSVGVGDEASSGLDLFWQYRY
jgi:translocation and assembly module TamB